MVLALRSRVVDMGVSRSLGILRGPLFRAPLIASLCPHYLATVLAPRTRAVNTGVCEQKHSPGKATLGKTSFHSINLGGRIGISAAGLQGEALHRRSVFFPEAPVWGFPVSLFASAAVSEIRDRTRGTGKYVSLSLSIYIYICVYIYIYVYT